MSNPTYGQGSDPVTSGGPSAGAVPDPFASDQDPYSSDQNPYPSDQPISYPSDQPLSSEVYADLPSQPADVSYGTVGESSDDSAGSRVSATRDAARGEASAVKDTAMDAGRSVAGTAREQAVTVKDEATTQARSLLSSVSEEVRSQGRTQQSRLAEYVHSLSKELGSMGARSEEAGPFSDLAQQASRKGGEFAHWLEEKEPGDLLEDVRSFARRRPAMFLGVCALAGIVVGRIGRSAVATNTSLDTKNESSEYGLSDASDASAATSYSTGISDTGYEAGYPTTSSYPEETGGPLAGGYGAGSMPESGGTYLGDQGLEPPYGGQGDVNR